MIHRQERPSRDPEPVSEADFLLGVSTLNALPRYDIEALEAAGLTPDEILALPFMKKIVDDVIMSEVKLGGPVPEGLLDAISGETTEVNNPTDEMFALAEAVGFSRTTQGAVDEQPLATVYAFPSGQKIYPGS